MSIEELEEEEEKEQEQVGRLREMKDILPEYELNHRYKLDEAKQMLKSWQTRYAELTPPAGTRPLDKPRLFQAQPSTVAEWQKRLSDVAHDLVAYEQQKVSQLAVGKAAAFPVGAPSAPKKATATEARMGRGAHKAVEWAPFGPKWLVSPQRLREDDVLAIVKASNKQKTPKHPNINPVVSAAMKVCLLAYLKGEPMPVELLSADEQEWLKWLMHEADIEHIKKAPQKLEIKRTPKQLKERLAVLYGEIAEGPNDNPLVKKEFKILFNKANLMGLLNESQIMNMQDFMKIF